MLGLILCLWVMSAAMGFGQSQPQMKLLQGLPQPLFPGDVMVSPSDVTPVNGIAYFAVRNLAHDVALWRSDGTAAGTFLLASQHLAGEMEGSNGRLFFMVVNGTTSTQLWRTDGTVAGTAMVKDLPFAAYDDFNGNYKSFYLTDVDGTLYFVAVSAVNGRALWKSDGTSAGTVLVKEFNPTTSFGDETISHLTSFKHQLIFLADDGPHQPALWVSDGTAAGTQLIKDILPPGGFSLFGNSRTRRLVATSDHVFFSGDDGTHGSEIWSSDGTPAGTGMIKDIVPGSYGSYPQEMVEMNGSIFFNCESSVLASNTDLWITDGTPAGTHMVMDPAHQTRPMNSTSFAVYNGKLFFCGESTASLLAEFWTSDGTDAGTYLVKSIRPNSGGSRPINLTVANGLLYFIATDDIHHPGLWVSDGTAGGTHIAADYSDGTAGSGPSNLTAFGNAMIFNALSGYGSGIWTMGTIAPFTPVKVIQQPMDQLVAPGGSATFTAAATGDPTPVYQWYKNGKVIPDAIKPSFTVPAAALADAASYSVQATNRARMVVGTARLAAVDPANVTVVANELSTLVLPVQAAGTGLTYQWLDGNGAVMKDGGRFGGTKTGKLSIAKLTGDDEAATYSCVVSLGSLSLSTGKFRPQVRYKPQIAVVTQTGPLEWNVSGSADVLITDMITVLNSQPPNTPTKFIVSGLPSGVTCDSATGELSGVPDVAGDYTVKITASNAAGASNSVSIPVHVNALPPGAHGTFDGLGDISQPHVLFGNIGAYWTGITIHLVVAANGFFTGSVFWNGSKMPVAGRIDITNGDPLGTADVFFPFIPKSDPSAGATLDFEIVEQTGALTAYLTTYSEYFPPTRLPLSGWRNTWSTTGRVPNPAGNFAAKYTAAVLPPVAGALDPPLPQGRGAITMAVSAGGGVSFAGHTSKGTAVTWNTTLGPGGQVSFLANDKGFEEVIEGWLKITPATGSTSALLDDDGGLLWSLNPNLGPLIVKTVGMTGGLWLPPAKNSIVFGLPDVLAGKNNAKVMFSQADIASSTLGAATGSIVQPLRLTTTGTVVVPAGAVVNPAGATLALNFATGTFSGTFSLKDPNPLNTKQIIVRSNSFYGALVPRLNQGQGYFLLNQLPKVAGDTSTNTPTLSGLVTLQGLVP